MRYIFIVVGISGNLSKLKILPGIGDFARQVDISDNIEIYGFSRSELTLENVQKCLGSNIPDNIIKIELIRGDYNDSHLIQPILDELDAEVYTYLAIPPTLYSNFLKKINKPASTHSKILIEKPFASSFNAFTKLSKLITQQNLIKNILFVDHYNFKLALDIIPKDTFNLAEIKSIRVEILESIGIEERLSYYSETGALKDMLTHILNLVIHSVKNLIKKHIIIQEITIKQFFVDQYQEIRGKIPPNIPTFFDLSGNIQINGYNLKIEAVSGKEQSQKLTQLTIDTTKKQIILQLAPRNFLRIDNNILTAQETGQSDHLRMFISLAKHNYNKFLSLKEAGKIIALEQAILNQI